MMMASSTATVPQEPFDSLENSNLLLRLDTLRERLKSGLQKAIDFQQVFPRTHPKATQA